MKSPQLTTEATLCLLTRDVESESGTIRELEKQEANERVYFHELHHCVAEHFFQIYTYLD